MKSKEEIIHQQIGIAVDASSRTPMDKWECLSCMDAYAAQFQSPSLPEQPFSLADIDQCLHEFVTCINEMPLTGENKIKATEISKHLEEAHSILHELDYNLAALPEHKGGELSEERIFNYKYYALHRYSTQAMGILSEDMGEVVFHDLVVEQVLDDFSGNMVDTVMRHKDVGEKKMKAIHLIPKH